MLVTLSPAIEVWKPEVDIELGVSTTGAAVSRYSENDCTFDVVVPTRPGTPGGFGGKGGVGTAEILVTLSPTTSV